MLGEVVISGGTDVWGGPYPCFPIADRHTVFEWCMIYTDQHPADGEKWLYRTGNHNETTVEAMQARKTILGALSPPPGQSIDDRMRIANAVFHELADWIRSGSIPCKSVYLDEAPCEIDYTLCVIDKGPVLDLARGRGDGG